jgi:deoxyguanosine kinase
MNEVFLCLGGNIGDRIQNLNTAKALIRELCGKITKESPIYETESWGRKSSKRFLNQVIKIKTALSPEMLMLACLDIEKQLGRKRTKIKNADRTIDIDILFFGKRVSETENVLVPHPRLHLRKFVLLPLNDIAPRLIHPVFQKSISALLEECNDTLEAEKLYQAHYICIEGNIGSGKTTLATDLSRKLNCGFLPEQFEKNDLLPLFYTFPEEYAFPLEYSFLLNRFQQIRDGFKTHTVLVSDYSIYKCLWFAKVNLSKKDYSFFKKHFASLERQIPKPDLIIYLDTNTKNLQENIKKRGRSYEKNIKDEYLENVGQQYLKGLRKIKNIRKLIIPVKEYNQETSGELIKTIKNYLD